MNKIDEIADRHNARNVRLLSTSRVNSELESSLRDLAVKLESTKPPVVIWNILPSQTFSVLHAIYAEKLRQLANLGFHCVVTIFDGYVRDRLELQGRELDQLYGNCHWLASWMLAAGIPEQNVEFILESDLREQVGGETEFVRGLTLLAHMLEESPDRHNDFGSPLQTLSGLFEIYYETLIDADLVLAGEVDASSTWHSLRRLTSATRLFGSHPPPLICEFPMFSGVDGKRLRADSPIGVTCIGDDVQKIVRDTVHGERAYVEAIYNFLYSPSNEANGARGYADAVAEEGEFRTRTMIAGFLKDHFRGIAQRVGRLQ